MTYDYRNDPILGGALAYWLRKRGNRTMPRKRDIDPVDMPRKILSHLQIIETAGGRFRYRLVGTAIVEAFGREYTGQYLDEAFLGDRSEYIRGIYRAACAACRPVFSQGRYITKSSREIWANRLYLPLSDDGITVNFLVGALTFDGGIAPIEDIWGTESIRDAQPVEEIDLSIPVVACPGREAA